MFTPGIEALSRLGCQTSGVEFLDVISVSNNLSRLTHNELLITGSVPVTAKVSVEVWIRIGDFITSLADLVTLASISPQATAAAAYFARYPWIEEFRLVDVIASGPFRHIPETTKDTDGKHIQCYFHELGRAKFTAVRDGRRIDIELNLSIDEAPPSPISLEVQTYLSGPAAMTHNKLYISVLNDDDDSS
jgi:hypothetical protein